MNNVLVIGSINMDLVVSAERFPEPGETVLGKSFCTFPGGKGANQAVAAARLGANVSLIGCIGDDAFGKELIATLNNEGIDTRHVQTAHGNSTGVATITLSRSENSIVVIPGANHALTPEHLNVAKEAFDVADVVLCQLEIPLPVVEAAANLAAEYGKPFLLNPAPAMRLPSHLLDLITLLTPNEHELGLVFAESSTAWQQLLVRNPLRVLMTHGADGAWFSDAGGQLRQQPAIPVHAVDTTGAGDTFNGALAAFWGRDLSELALLACAAGTLSVTKKGAQSGMPTREQLERFLATDVFAGKVVGAI
jgi:ribokinase